MDHATCHIETEKVKSATYHPRTMLFRLVLLSALSLASATTLTPDNWDAETAGKTVFIKFLAPW